MITGLARSETKKLKLERIRDGEYRSRQRGGIVLFKRREDRDGSTDVGADQTVTGTENFMSKAIFVIFIGSLSPLFPTLSKTSKLCQASNRVRHAMRLVKSNLVTFR